MEHSIFTKKGKYLYRPIDLYRGRKTIDRDISRKNLIDLDGFLCDGGVHHGVIYGTLLGIIRDGDLIEWDEDTDIFILDEDRDDFLNLLFDLREIGFDVVRFTRDLVSLMRNGEYTDIYIFRRSVFGKRRCGSDVVKAFFLEKISYIEFLGKNIGTVSCPEKFLEMAYGKNWKVPIKDKPADVRGLSSKLKDYVRPILPKNFIFLYKKIKELIKDI